METVMVIPRSWASAIFIPVKLAMNTSKVLSGSGMQGPS